MHMGLNKWKGLPILNVLVLHYLLYVLLIIEPENKSKCLSCVHGIYMLNLANSEKNNGELSYSNFSILLTTEPSNYWCVFSFLILARTSYSKYWRVKTFGIIFFSTNSMINVNTCSIQLNLWHKTPGFATPMSWNHQEKKFLTRQTTVLIWYK